MKVLKLMAAVIIAATMSSVFTACSDDDNSDEPGTAITQNRRIKTINYNGYNLTCELAYDENNRLTGFVGKYANNDFEFNQSIAYNDGMVIITGEADSNDGEWQYQLNDKGFAKSCQFTSNEQYSYYSNDYTISFNYSGDYLNGITVTDEYGDSNYTFTINNGNLTSCSGGYKSWKLEYDGSYENKSGVINPVIEDLLWECMAAYYAGILGKPYKNLPSSFTEISEHVSSTNYIYGFDDDGYVTSYTYDDGSVTFVYE